MKHDHPEDGFTQKVDGHYFTKEQLEEQVVRRKAEYFDLLDISKRLNRGLIGGHEKHSMAEKVAKI